MEDQTGSGLCVIVSKSGYYARRDNPSCFEYAQPYAQNFHVPDPSNPVVFHLRKKGHGVALITSENGMRSNVKLSISMDGAPVKVDLLHQKAGDTGPLEISQIKPDKEAWQTAKQWSFQMTIPGGGLIEHHDDFPFEAPETGYEPAIELQFQRDETNWTTGVSKDYYIRFGNPPLYGRLHVQTSIDERGARLTYAINPDGSRNLEPQ